MSRIKSGPIPCKPPRRFAPPPPSAPDRLIGDDPPLKPDSRITPTTMHGNYPGDFFTPYWLAQMIGWLVASIIIAWFFSGWIYVVFVSAIILVISYLIYRNRHRYVEMSKRKTNDEQMLTFDESFEGYEDINRERGTPHVMPPGTPPPPDPAITPTTSKGNYPKKYKE